MSLHKEISFLKIIMINQRIKAELKGSVTIDNYLQSETILICHQPV